MKEIISFGDALKVCGEAKLSLLLGNGFSISLFPGVFSYSSLLKQAEFEKDSKVEKVFKVLNTPDFERVIRALSESSKVVPIFSNTNAELVNELKTSSEALKNTLVATITKHHPNKISEIDEKHFLSCNKFLSSFKNVYTLNYDLLLYWTLLHQDEASRREIDDGFRNPDDIFGKDYRVFDSPHSPTFWYMHGGLHLFDAESEIRKYVWSDTGKPIMEQVREALDKNMYPLYVSEGTAKEKMTKINHSSYLSKALRSFEGVCNYSGTELFIHGHSLDSNDDHIITKIIKGKHKRVFISLYRESEKHNYDQNVIKKVESIQSRRNYRYPLDVIFYDATSANVWNNF